MEVIAFMAGRILPAILTLFTAAIAVPMMPGMVGLGYGNGYMSPGTNPAFFNNVGATYKPGTSPQISAVVSGPLSATEVTLLTSLDETYNGAAVLTSGLAVTIHVQNKGFQNGDKLDMFGVPMFGMAYGLMGAAKSLNMLAGADGSPTHGELEAIIEIYQPAGFVGGTFLIVFTEAAVNSIDDICPLGPIMTGPDSVLNSFNKMGDMHGHGTGAFPMASMFPGMMTNPYFGAGIMGGYSGIPGYSGFSGLTVPSAGYLGVGANNGMGFMGGHGLAAGNMGGLPTGFGMFGAPTPPDFGVMAEIDITAGFNTFMIQGLGKFMDLNELSGRGIAICVDVEIAATGKPYCTSEPLMCGKLGYSPESVSVHMNK